MFKRAGFAAGSLVTGIVCAVAVTGVIVAFLANASPYVTIAQAKTSQADRLHLAGQIVKPTLRQDILLHTTTFDLIDAKGDKITVVYRGEPQRFDEAKEVVMIGGVKGGKFVSNDALVKCPSKYQSEKKS